MRKETIIGLTDIRFVAITCLDCNTRVILDMESGPASMKTPGAFTPKECPGCMKDYDSAIRPALDRLQKAYEGLLPIASRISFRGEPEETE